jgi:hypothetical protein
LGESHWIQKGSSDAKQKENGLSQSELRVPRTSGSQAEGQLACIPAADVLFSASGAYLRDHFRREQIQLPRVRHRG